MYRGLRSSICWKLASYAAIELPKVAGGVFSARQLESWRAKSVLPAASKLPFFRGIFTAAERAYLLQSKAPILGLLQTNGFFYCKRAGSAPPEAPQCWTC